MATTTVSRTDLVGLTSLSFIRQQRISFSVTGTKPTTVLYAFFDGVNVGKYVTPSGGSLGSTITTNSAGEISGTFDIPPATFNTGERIFRLQDSSNFDASTVPGAIQGSASATFTSSGLLKTYQETITNTTENVVTLVNNVIDAQPVVSPSVNNSLIVGQGNSGGVDPLAQTFFTYGVIGGCYVTKIDIYFQAKDPSIPVILEIRNVTNGYPSSTLVSKYARVTLPPASVAISNNSSLATTFTFSRPIYLEENKDYCFVLLTNSNAYNVWTSTLGDKSVETGKTIFDQPYVGSLFKSENNITWTAQQTEDIKFTLYRANFTPGTTDVTFKANAQNMLLQGEDLSVVSGSPVVTINFKFQHGQRTGDKIVLTGIANGNYRGIPTATISNPAGFSITVVDEDTITFNVGTNATSTGTLASSGILNSVLVDSTGSGYVSPSISFSGGGGTGAAATAVVSGGKIVSVTVTNKGTGYTSAPTLTLTDSAGTGAVLTPISEAIFVTNLNRKYQNVAAIIENTQPPGTSISNSIRTSSEDYTVGQYTLLPLNTATSTNKEAVLVTPITETASFGSNNSTEMLLHLSTTNANVSPLVDLGEVPKLRMHNFLINGTSNASSELTPSSGTAQARYISKIITLDTVSKGVRCIVNASSTLNCSFDVFIRTSLSSNTSTAHRDGNWVALNCDTLRNLSTDITDFKDYTFYLDGISPFNVYDLKIVLYTQYKHEFPIIANYRNIILAT